MPEFSSFFFHLRFEFFNTASPKRRSQAHQYSYLFIYFIQRISRVSFTSQLFIKMNQMVFYNLFALAGSMFLEQMICRRWFTQTAQWIQ